MTKIFEFPKYKQHPLAVSLMPGGMDDSEFTAFKEDVEERGIIMPITLYEGMVLDGWHRYRAAEATGTSFKEIEYKGKDPAGYIASVNVLRRKLGSLQRALVGVRLHLDHGLTQREVCKKLGISNEVVNMVLRAVNSKSAKLIKRLETDTDFSRGMLREELEDAGLLRSKAGDESPHVPNSVFDVQPRDTSGIGDEEPDDDLPPPVTGTVGDDKLVPVVGKKNAHKERKAADTPAHTLAGGFKALMSDEKATFLQMIWPEARGIAADIGLKYKPETDGSGIDHTNVDELLGAPAKKAPASKKTKKA